MTQNMITVALIVGDPGHADGRGVRDLGPEKKPPSMAPGGVKTRRYGTPFSRISAFKL